MSDHKFQDPILCVIKKVFAVHTRKVTGYDFYEVTVQENGKDGMLICDTQSGLSIGQEFMAHFIKIDYEGKYLLGGELSEPPQTPDSGNVLNFPTRKKTT